MNKSVLALDIGGKRIGVAIASRTARLPRPLTTLLQDEGFWSRLEEIIQAESIDTIVVGWPRGLEGQSTSQTTVVEAFARELQEKLRLPVEFQDEALTSQKAESELETRGKPYKKEDTDALAATYILEDWLVTHPEAGV